MSEAKSKPQEMCVAWCHTCKKIIGPNSSVTVGETLALRHETCKFTIIDTWRET